MGSRKIEILNGAFIEEDISICTDRLKNEPISYKERSDLSTSTAKNN